MKDTMKAKENPTLKELREMSGKSRREVAQALGVSPNAWTNYEHGIRRISLEYVLILATLFECTEREIIEAQLNSCQSVL